MERKYYAEEVIGHPNEKQRSGFVDFHQKLTGTNGPLSKSLELLGPFQWVLLEISWIIGNLPWRYGSGSSYNMPHMGLELGRGSL